MRKCIRCGKSCADGETMCSECQAWFQQKTGVAAPNRKETLNSNPLQKIPKKDYSENLLENQKTSVMSDIPNNDIYGEEAGGMNSQKNALLNGSSVVISKKVIVGASVLVGVLVVTIVLVFVSLTMRDDTKMIAQEGYQQENGYEVYEFNDYEDNTDEGKWTEGDLSVKGDVYDVENSYSNEDTVTFPKDFTINPRNSEKYEDNLEPSEYGYYDSGISDFSFYYPINLYEEIERLNESDSTVYGDNLETITFRGAEGSTLFFELFRRTDSRTLEEMTDYVYNEERKHVSDMEDILHKTLETHGKVIFTGWTDSSYEKTVYKLIKIEGEYILSMEIVMPNYTSHEDELQKGYITECLYRMCGFSDSTSSWRSYSEYMEDK